MLRLLPYRQHHEVDVINMFALEDASVNQNITGVGSGDNGVFVKITTGNFNADPVAYGDDSYLGKTNYPHVGYAKYPKVAKKVAPAGSGEAKLVLGITLSQTALYDENGEKILYYRAKKEDQRVVAKGEAVPIATRGIFTISANAFDGSITGGDYVVGTGLTISNNGGGKVTGYDPTASGASAANLVATVIGTGSRTSQTNTDQFAGEYLVIKLK